MDMFWDKDSQSWLDRDLGIDSPYAKERKEKIKQTNRQNKQRARAMEQRIARFLGAQRVAFSGAGHQKGDVRGKSNFGDFIIECKMSAGQKSGPSITIPSSFLSKLEEEVRTMGARFGALIFHYHGIGEDFVLVSANTFRMFGNPDHYPVVASPKKGQFIFKYKWVKEVTREYVFSQIVFDIGAFILMPLPVFRTMIQGEVEEMKEIIDNARGRKDLVSDQQTTS